MEEIEIKIPIENEHHSLVVLASKFECTRDVFERDMYFDRKYDPLSRTDRVLRIRIQNDTVFIAYKGSRIFDNGIVSRDEFETIIAEKEVALHIINGLGFYPVHIIEKKRQYYQNTNFQNLVITVDLLPFIGKFIEIEGNLEQINFVLVELGLERSMATELNYSELFHKHLNNNNIELDEANTKFTFDAASALQGS